MSIFLSHLSGKAKQKLVGYENETTLVPIIIFYYLHFGYQSLDGTSFFSYVALRVQFNQKEGTSTKFSVHNKRSRVKSRQFLTIEQFTHEEREKSNCPISIFVGRGGCGGVQREQSRIKDKYSSYRQELGYVVTSNHKPLLERNHSLHKLLLLSQRMELHHASQLPIHNKDKSKKIQLVQHLRRMMAIIPLILAIIFRFKQQQAA